MADAIREVSNHDRALYEPYRAASLEPLPLVWLQKRVQLSDDSPVAEVVTLAKSLAPADPWGARLEQVCARYPQLWRQYRHDYA